VKATLVVPTYNRADRLRALLHCASQQEGGHLARVVVCDDGSSDHTAEVVRSFEDRLPVVRVHQEDDGFRAGQARNLGIAEATGDIVIFTDDDLVFMPDFVAAHVRAHADADNARSLALGLRFRRASFSGDVPTLADVTSGERDDRIADLDGGTVANHESPWMFVYSCNFSVRRGGPELSFDEGYTGWGFEDLDIGYRLHRAGYAIFEAPEARVLHIDDPTPRDPFICENRGLTPSYDSYVQNAVYFMDRFPNDPVVAAFVRGDLRWYVEDEDGHWVKNGYENDVEYVIARCREQIATGHRPSPDAARDSA
jgi:glycosyltransferase involved in cell wall biosynthesis